MAAPLVTRSPLLVALLALVVVAALAWPAAGLRTDNSLSTWLPAGDAQRQVYETFRDDFGGDDFAVVAVVDRDPAELLDELPRLAERLRRVPGVERVLIPVVHALDGKPSLGVASPLEAPLLGERSAAAFVALGENLTAPARADALERIEQVGATAGDGWMVAGPIVINRALDRASQDEFTLLVPAAGLGVLFVLIIGLANLRAALVVVLGASLASAAILGVVAATGGALHMVLAVLPATLLVLGTSYAMHPVVRYLDDPVVPGEGDPERLRRLLGETLRPALIAAVTTAAGLGSLALAELPPVRDLGIYGAVGIGLAFGLAYTLVPALLLLLRVRPYGPRHGDGGPLVRGLMHVAHHRAIPVLVGGGLVLLLAISGLAQLRVESNVLHLLDPADPVRTATARIEDDLHGLTPIELRLDGSRDALFAASTAEAARTLCAQLVALPLVTHVLSPFEARDTLRREFGEDESGPEALAVAFPSHVTVAGERASLRMTVCSNTVSTTESEQLADQAGDLAMHAFSDEVEVAVTGSIPLLVRVQDALVRSQVRSFAGAFVLVSLVLLLELGSGSLALLSLVPNVTPALLAAGALGWFDVPLDAATVAVASVALGLAVDDTVHVLHRWKRAGGDLRPVFATTSRALVWTTTTAVVGFGSFAFSSFPPARRLGLLVAGSAVAALAADLLLLPALLVLLERFRNRRTSA